LIDDKALKPPITAVENTTVNFWDKVKENISYNLLLILGLGALILAIIFGLLLYEEKRRHKATLKKLNG
jgi:hypothetical protein